MIDYDYCYTIKKYNRIRNGGKGLLFMNISKEERDYYRVILKDVSEEGLDKPITMAGRYQYDTRYEYATFTNIRILLNPPYSKTRLICNHLNILRNDISRFYSISEKDDKKKFYFVGFPVEYMYNGDIRYGFKLSDVVTFAPVGLLSERDNVQEKMDRECYNLTDWVQNNLTRSEMGILRKNNRKKSKNGASF